MMLVVVELGVDAGQFCGVIVDSHENVSGAWIEVSTHGEEGSHSKTLMLY